MDVPAMLTLAAQSDNETAMTVIAVVFGVCTAIFAAMYFRERHSRQTMEQRFAGFMSEVEDRRTNESRNNVMFEQQKQLNDLMAAKFQAELRLLEAQLATMKNHPDREEAGKEAHELMVEKTRLEIDGLRLHNAEARRRAEDWRGD